MLQVAIFNGFPFHYEMFGYIIYWCQQNNHELVIYTETRDNMGWLDWYNKHFNKQDYCSIKNFVKEAHWYDIIILTTDDDYHFKDTWLPIFGMEQKIVCINHTSVNRRPSIKKQINIRNFNDNLFHALPVFPIVNTIERNNDKINILFYSGVDFVNRYDQTAVNKLCNLPNVICHFIGRTVSRSNLNNCFYYQKIETNEMINIIKSCHYFFFGLNDWSKNNTQAISGFLPLAFSCGLQVITKEITCQSYNFTSCLTYKNQIDEILPLTIPNCDKVFSERSVLINLFDSAIKTIFPKLFVVEQQYNTKIPKIIHLMWLNKNGNDEYPHKYQRNIDTWKHYNSDYKIKIWNTSSIDKLIQKHLPQYYQKFSNYKKIISKCDFARFCVIYIYGGLYVDLDFYCRKNISNLLYDKDLLLFEELPEHEPKYNQLYNGCFAAVPKHKFIKGWLKQMMKLYPEDHNDYEIYNVMETTGPLAFWKYYDSLINKPELGNKCLIMPFTNSFCLSKNCPEFHDCYCYTLWTEGSGWSVIEDNAVYVIITILVIIVLIIIIYLLIKYWKNIIIISTMEI